MNRQPRLDFYEMGAGVKAFSSTRHGGWSKGNYAAFNINRYCGDEEENIRLNRQTLCQMLGINDDHLVMPHQVHETKVAQIDGRFLAMNAGKRQEELEGVDALMTNISGVCIGVSTADCIPVLLYDQEKKAICAIHAGWRGTVKRIVMKAIEAMTEAYGTQPQQLVAQIGPGIHLECFEVGDEVYDSFAQDGFDMAAIARRFPANDGMGEKWHIDLPACNRLQLMDSGVNPQNITVSSVCTFQQATDYFSARRLGIDSGRIFSGILLKENR